MLPKTEEGIRMEMDLGIQMLLSCFQQLRIAGQVEGFEREATLRVASNRVFLCVEHFANALVLGEFGAYSKRHMMDVEKYVEAKNRLGLKSDVKGLYIGSYDLRSFADYGADRGRQAFTYDAILTLARQAWDLLMEMMQTVAKINANELGAKILLVEKEIALNGRPTPPDT
ncbi:MAG: hypothetical protein HY520_01710 [Candidatus Aenigmarchaeota archaeon]|nr:hypothetical protein [Candidatus Aenigmarchaeota archaeon]